MRELTPKLGADALKIFSHKKAKVLNLKGSKQSARKKSKRKLKITTNKF